jgi:uncharacterized membrane protein
MNTNQHHGAEEAATRGNKNMMAIFSYLWILIVVPFLTNAKNDPFVKFHLRQGLTLIVFEVVGWVVAMFIWIIPILGALIIWLWWLVSLIFAIMGIVNVLNGREKELPWIGRYGKSFNF